MSIRCSRLPSTRPAIHTSAHLSINSQLSVALESTIIALHAMCADWEACGRRPAKAWTLSTHDCVSIGSPDPHSSEAFVQPDSGDLMFALVPVLAD